MQAQAPDPVRAEATAAMAEKFRSLAGRDDYREFCRLFAGLPTEGQVYLLARVVEGVVDRSSSISLADGDLRGFGLSRAQMEPAIHALVRTLTASATVPF